MPGDYPLPSSEPASLGFAAKPLDHLDRLIKQHIEEGRYPGAQIALARHGQLGLFRTYAAWMGLERLRDTVAGRRLQVHDRSVFLSSRRRWVGW